VGYGPGRGLARPGAPWSGGKYSKDHAISQTQRPSPAVPRRYPRFSNGPPTVHPPTPAVNAPTPGLVRWAPGVGASVRVRWTHEPGVCRGRPCSQASAPGSPTEHLGLLVLPYWAFLSGYPKSQSPKLSISRRSLTTLRAYFEKGYAFFCWFCFTGLGS